MGWDKELKDYRYYLKLEKKLSDNTVRAYLHDLSQIADYMEREFSIAEPELVTAGQIEMFLSHLYDTGVEKATQARVLSAFEAYGPKAKTGAVKRQTGKWLRRIGMIR